MSEEQARKIMGIQGEMESCTPNSNKRALATVNEMCEHSLSPDEFEAWEHVLKALLEVRSDLK